MKAEQSANGQYILSDSGIAASVNRVSRISKLAGESKELLSCSIEYVLSQSSCGQETCASPLEIRASAFCLQQSKQYSCVQPLVLMKKKSGCESPQMPHSFLETCLKFTPNDRNHVDSRSAVTATDRTTDPVSDVWLLLLVVEEVEAVETVDEEESDDDDSLLLLTCKCSSFSS